MVLDCGGRRSPVPAWLAEHDVVLPIEEQDCDTSYYTRYFRLNPESGLPQMLLFALRGEVADTMFVGFAGDHDAFGITLMVRPADAELRVLRHNWAWDAFARSIEPVAGWIDPATSTPITDVLVMASHKNTRRQFVMNGEPLVLGVLPVGDSLCTTNPTYGWGASMAVTFAMAAVDAIDGHVADPRALALAYDDAVRGEAYSVYRESAAMDRLRMYRLTNTPIPAHDADEMRRQELIGAVLAGAAKDPVLGRATLRRVNLLDRPSDILDDPDVEARARHALELLATRTPRKIGPTRQELSDLLAAANPRS